MNVLRTLALSLVLLTATSGCESQRSSANGASIGSGLGNPADYFPMAQGMRWEYRITTGAVDALQYCVTTWPQGDKSIMMETRGLFRGPMMNKQLSYTLAFHVAGTGTDIKPFELAPGAKLAVDKDDFGIFEDLVGVGWKVLGSDTFQVILITLHSPDAPGAPSSAWGGWGQEPGYALRHFFFGAKPGTGLSFGDESRDTLVFIGPEQSPNARFVGKALHFRRVVNARHEKDEPGNTLASPFTEDVWFVRKVGLVRLEQRVDDKPSMTWDLTAVSP
ncbi:MAG: hypothetical protein HY566_01705 [Candidatus Kerfeldbacteria bacterium]|nr:hypothetical protein [Candidatus Kerfeldbacteria bacterium]